jgi:hypothetical protein
MESQDHAHFRDQSYSSSSWHNKKRGELQQSSE